jgi:hypothetical protein
MTMTNMGGVRWAAVLAFAGLTAALTAASEQGRGAGNPFPGGTNEDGSLRPTAPVSRLFTQDAYTEYLLLEPGSASFRIRFLPEQTRVGATELVNATRGGSEGSDIEVYDPRTGKPLEFTYEQQGNDPDSHAIRVKLPRPVPEGGIGRVLIYTTYKDPRTYMMNGEDIVWVRSLSGYRLGVVLPEGFAFIASTWTTSRAPICASRARCRKWGTGWPAASSCSSARCTGCAIRSCCQPDGRCPPSPNRGRSAPLKAARSWR